MDYKNLAPDDVHELCVQKLVRLTKPKLLELYKILGIGDQVELKYCEYPKQVSTMTIPQLCRYITDILEDKSQSEKHDKILKYVFDKKITTNIEKCCTCMEYMGAQKNSLPCGHWCHFKCLAKQLDFRCPICRKDLKGQLNWQVEEKIQRNINLKKWGAIWGLSS